MYNDYEDEDNYSQEGAMLDAAGEALDNVGDAMSRYGQGQGINGGRKETDPNKEAPGSEANNNSLQGDKPDGGKPEGAEGAEAGNNISEQAGDTAAKEAGESAAKGAGDAAKGMAEATKGAAEAGAETAEVGAEAAGTAATGGVGGVVVAAKKGLEAALDQAKSVMDTSGGGSAMDRAGSFGKLAIICGMLFFLLAYCFGFFGRRGSSAQNDNYREVTLSKHESGLGAGEGDDDELPERGGDEDPDGDFGEGIEGMINKALSLCGKIPYVWGGASLETGVDCSGFTMCLFRDYLGISLPHSSLEQSKMGREVSVSDLKKGDLIFYGHPVHHVAIYIGDGKIVHAQSKKAGLRTSRYDYSDIATIRRFT